MSAIAHWLEQHGLSTVVIGLVRLHLEKIKPPRALWVPFELGRPLGAPGDRDFQKKVLLKALSLIETQTAPTLTDFGIDDPRASADENWQPPEIATAETVAEECTLLKPFYQRQCVSSSRTAVGVSTLTIQKAAELMDEVVSGKDPTDTPDGNSPVVSLRLAFDDLKAYYIETALTGGSPNSLQIHNWLWQETLLGQQIKALRHRFMASDNPKLAALGERFSVPHRWRD
ncbi:hypothetical protein AB833_31865 [Chromatiales bacterium (ex Bugula neritina AB1)]|nr:hypothetical protein AB833_31865 [Chromatiales bacterium (ex Bugula neritina AB1)]